MGMKSIHRDQRGFSLVELIIVIGLTGLITAAITMTVFQVFNINTRTANRLAAVSQVQHAGKIVSEDILEARPGTIIPDPEGEQLLILTLSATNVTVTYTLDDDGVLWRSEPVDGGDPILTRVAEYIDSSPTNTDCYWDDGASGSVLIFMVTAAVGDESETRIYRVQPRPGSS